MVLAHSEITDRLDEIFLPGTSEKKNVKEASYALRVARDGLLVNNNAYPPESQVGDGYITIQPGRIAVLSSVERFTMPLNLVGQLGIRFDFAIRGLTALVGIQVDPGYGRSRGGEPVFMRVANLGDQAVSFRPGESVFMVEFKNVTGTIPQEVVNSKSSTWDRIETAVLKQPHPHWSYVTQVKANLDREVAQVRGSLWPLVMFGVFLISATLLGGIVAVLLNFQGVSAGSPPSWFTEWGWGVLVITIASGAIVTALLGLLTIISTVIILLKHVRTGSTE